MYDPQDSMKTHRHAEWPTVPTGRGGQFNFRWMIIHLPGLGAAMASLTEDRGQPLIEMLTAASRLKGKCPRGDSQRNESIHLESVMRNVSEVMGYF